VGNQLVGSVAMAVDVEVEVEVGSLGTGYIEKKASTAAPYCIPFYAE